MMRMVRSWGDRQLQTIALLGSALVAAMMVLPVWLVPTAAGANDGGQLPQLQTIEASLAYKKPNQPKQPQKPTAPAPPPDPVTGMSRDDQKPPEPKAPKKPDQPPPPVTDPNNPFGNLRRPDEAPGPDTPQLGAFDGSEHGFAEESRGDPYFQKLVGDLLNGWEYPEILTDAGEPVGCLHLEATGKVANTKFKDKSGVAELDDSVERQLDKLKKLRNADPVPVPTHLLAAATTKWVCFRFRVKK